MKVVIDNNVITWFDTISSQLPTDKKFIVGDKFTIYDIAVGGFLTDYILNPNIKNADLMKEAWEKAPERIKKYYDDFVSEMKPYLDSRPQDCTI